MDHSEAVRLQAAEKYVLGELPPDLREEYEEHYFDCAQCALDVKTAAVFVDSARQVLSEQRSGSPMVAQELPAGWFRWFRPAIAVPAFALLLLMVVYQNFFSIPQMRERAQLQSSQIANSFSLLAANARGEGGVRIQVHPNEGFILNFDFIPSRPSNSYSCEFQDAAGRALLKVPLLGTKANQNLSLSVSQGVAHPGEYDLIFYAGPDSKSPAMKANEVQRLTFTVEFLQ